MMTAYYRPRYRSWYRPRRDVPMPVVIGAGVLLAALAGTGTAKVTHTHVPVINPAPAGRYTPQTWAPAFLRLAGLPRTPCDRAAVVAWIGAEGSNPAWHNLLDSTLPEPGSRPVNLVGVQAYTSWRQGLRANADTIRNGYYPGVLAALEAGGDAQAVADAVAQSPWGTQPFSASC